MRSPAGPALASATTCASDILTDSFHLQGTFTPKVHAHAYPLNLLVTSSLPLADKEIQVEELICLLYSLLKDLVFLK